MISRNSVLRCWLGWNERQRGTFYSGGPSSGPVNNALQFAKGRDKGLVVLKDGMVKVFVRTVQGANPRGNLVFKRDGKTMAIIEADRSIGYMYCNEDKRLADWLLM